MSSASGRNPHAAALEPGDVITLHGRQQTVAEVKTLPGPTIAVYTDFTGDDPWLLDPGAHVPTNSA
jgi:hypothetical protein